MMPFIEELPKKKIQDFFAEGDPERTSQKPHSKQSEKKTRIPVSKQNRKKIVTYLDDETYNFFKRYCSEHDMKPSLVVRHLIKECLKHRPFGMLLVSIEKLDVLCLQRFPIFFFHSL